MDGITESLLSKALHIIAELTSMVNRLLPRQHIPTAAALRACYITQGNREAHKNKLMASQTITVLSTQNTVPGQIVPVAIAGVTVEPITTINAGSELYTVVDQSTGTTSTVATVAPVSGGAEGQFAVVRITGQSGGVGDTIIFQGQPTGVASALTATYGTPV